MAGVRALFELQETDGQIDARKKRLAEIEGRLRGDEEVGAARRDLEAREARLRSAEAFQKSLEWDIENARTRASSLEARMYGGQVANPKELTAMTAEIAHLKDRQKELEDSLLAAMEATERARQETVPQRGLVDDLEKRWLATQGHLVEEKRRLESELPQWQARRQGQAAALPDAARRLYEQLRASRGHIAVARAERGLCSGCRISLPTTLVQRARADREFTYCSSCGRLLYAA